MPAIISTVPSLTHHRQPNPAQTPLLLLARRRHPGAIAMHRPSGSGSGSGSGLARGGGSGSGPGVERSPSSAQARRVVVARRLPLRAEANPEAPHGFDFFLDSDALACFELHHGLTRPVVFVGLLPPAAASIEESDVLAADLLDRFSCLPVMLSQDLQAEFNCFCDHHLLPSTRSDGSGSARPNSRELYRSFLIANNHFADRVVDILDPEEDLVFVDDYHLWPLPAMLRHRSPRARARIAMFPHSAFTSSSEIVAVPGPATAPAPGPGPGSGSGPAPGRGSGSGPDAERAPSSAQARRIVVAHHLPLRAEANPEAPHGVDYFLDPYALAFQLSNGLTCPVVFVGTLPPAAAASIEESDVLAADLLERFSCLPVFVPVELKADFDSFYEHYMRPLLNSPSRAPAGARPCNAELYNAFLTANSYFAERIMEILDPDHDQVLVNDYQLWALPTVLRNKSPRACIHIFLHSPFPSSDLFAMPVREDVLRALLNADLVGFPVRDYARHFLNACSMLFGVETVNRLGSIFIIYYGRRVTVKTFLQKLFLEDITPAYRQSSDRLILLDYDGTVMPQELMTKAPSQEVVNTLKKLCLDPKNTVFLVSGRGKDQLASWFAPCGRLGIAAENGYFTRWRRGSPWESCKLVINFGWKDIALPVMTHYTRLTVGSWTEVKETSLVWHYEEANTDLGPFQAKKLQHHLQSLLSNEPVCVKSGYQVVEINPQGVSKGVAVENLVSAMGDFGSYPDFILCVGDDRSDEGLIVATTTAMKDRALAETVKMFPCTVGYEPSLTKAKYYLGEPDEVLDMLQGLAQLSTEQTPADFQRLFRVANEGYGRLILPNYDGQSAAELGVYLTKLAAQLSVLNIQLTEGAEFVNEVIPYLELVPYVLGGGAIGGFTGSTVAALQYLCSLAGRTAGGIAVAQRIASGMGFELQLMHPRAQSGCRPTDALRFRDVVVVSNLEEAREVIKKWKATNGMVLVEVPEDMRNDEARKIYSMFVEYEAYELVMDSEVLRSKIQDESETDWEIS